jgi:hypothetical protein
MNPADIPKTAFSTHLGHYEHLVMAFWVVQRPRNFSRTNEQHLLQVPQEICFGLL